MIRTEDQRLTLIVKNLTTGESITIHTHEQVELEIQDNGKFVQSLVAYPDGLNQSLTEKYENFVAS